MAKPLPENFAPYASSRAVLGVIRRFRERGLPDPVTAEALEQVGVPHTMAPWALVALRFLGLVDEGGNRTEAFERLRRANSEEYPETLGEIVRKAYLPVFTVVDPAEDGDIAIGDAFRRYDPMKQRDRMVRLFMGLSTEAGIVAARTQRQRSTQPRRQAPTPAPSTPQQTPRPEQHEQDGDDATDYRLISAIIQQIPKGGKWTSGRRERWMLAMASAVDLLIATVEEESEEG